MLDSVPAPEPPQPAAERRVHGNARLRALLEVFLISGFPSQILLIGLLAGSGVAMKTPEGRLNPAFVFTVSLVDALIVVGLIVMMLRASGESFRQVLIGRRPVAREALFGMVLVPVVFLLVICVMALVLTYAPWLRNVPQNPLQDLIRNRFDAIVFGVVVMVAGGVREEIQRGFIVHRFEGYLGGGGIGVVIYSILFGLGHYEQGWDASLVTGTLGIMWGVVYLRRRSVVAPVVSHAGFNLAQVIKAVWLR